MQPTNQSKSIKSRCSFCGSADYGKGCRFAPHGVHMHQSNGAKCVYCGSTNYGKGCRLNPTSNLHVHGINYNSMFQESLQSHLDDTFLVNELKKDFKEFCCYSLGIINEKGDRIKVPLTEEEKRSYNSFTRTVIRLKKLLGSKVDLLKASLSLEKENCVVNEGFEKRLLRLKYQTEVDNKVNELYRTFEEAQREGLTLKEIQSFIKA